MEKSGRPTVDEFNDEIALRVLEGVASTKDRGIADLDPLYATLDPDALGALFRRSDGELRVVFEYEGQTVTVHDDRQVRIEESF